MGQTSANSFMNSHGQFNPLELRLMEENRRLREECDALKSKLGDMAIKHYEEQEASRKALKTVSIGAKIIARPRKPRCPHNVITGRWCGECNEIVGQSSVCIHGCKVCLPCPKCELDRIRAITAQIDMVTGKCVHGVMWGQPCVQCQQAVQ